MGTKIKFEPSPVSRKQLVHCRSQQNGSTTLKDLVTKNQKRIFIPKKLFGSRTGRSHSLKLLK
jgi:hypothetical protein